MEIHQLFASWPDAIPKSGSVVTSFGETIPFSAFMICGDLILFDRATPDAHGVRRAIVKSSELVAVKFHEAIEMARFISMGFQKPEHAVTASFS